MYPIYLTFYYPTYYGYPQAINAYRYLDMGAPSYQISQIPFHTIPATVNAINQVDKTSGKVSSQSDGDSQLLDNAAKQELRLLQFIKLAVTATITGGVDVFLLGANPVAAWAIEYMTGAMEAMMSQKVFEAKGHLSAQILRFCNRLTGGEDKPAELITPSERMKALIPLSGLAAARGSLIVATFTEVTKRLQRAGILKAKPHTPGQNTFINKLKNELCPSGLKVFLKQLRPLWVPVQKQIKRIGLEEKMNRHPWLRFGIALVYGLTWGLMEGTIAYHITRAKLKRDHQY